MMPAVPSGIRLLAGVRILICRASGVATLLFCRVFGVAILLIFAQALRALLKKEGKKLMKYKFLLLLYRYSRRNQEHR